MLRALIASALAFVAMAAHADDLRKHSKKLSRKIEKRYHADYSNYGYYRWGSTYRPAMVIAMNERAIIQRHFAIYYSTGHCPPGLARLDGECAPPGNAKRFVIGQALPGAINYGPLPPELGARLVTPPGHAYAYLDGHVLLVALASRLVVDAISIDPAAR